MPIYKRAEHLRDAFYSLILQTYKDFTVVVIDDHSPEPLKDEIDKYTDQLNIIYYYAPHNGGPGVARQIGLEICYLNNFEYVTFLDSDDILLPHAIEFLYKEIKDGEKEGVSSAGLRELPDGGYEEIWAMNEIWLHGKMYSLDYLKSKDIKFPTIRTNEDLAFNILAMECALKRGYVKEPLFLYKYNMDSITKLSETKAQVISTDHIEAVAYVAEYMINTLGGITEQVLAEIFCVYNYYQNGVEYGLMTEEIKEKTRYLLHLPAFKNAITIPDTIYKVTSIVNNFNEHQGKITFYKQSFIDWLKEFEVI